MSDSGFEVPQCRTVEYMAGRSLDIYEPENTSKKPLPTLLYLPGGGLVDCNKKQCTTPDKRWIPEKTLKNGILLLSAEYPTLRTTDGHGILKGVLALFNFIETELSDLVDTTRMGIYASSAGCYIALQAALHTQITFRGLALMWPMGPHFLDNPLWINPWPEIKGFFERLGPDQPLPRWLLDGTYLDQLTGEKGLNARLRALALEKREKMVDKALFPELNVLGAKRWPATGITHGLNDTATSPDESRHLKALLEARGDVTVELTLVEGGEHGLENGENAQAVREKLWKFVTSRL